MKNLNSDKINLVYTISSLSREGPVNVLLNIVSNIDRKKFNIHIITLNPEKKNSIISSFKNLNLSIIQLNKTKKRLFPPIFKYFKTLEIISPDIIHSHCLRSAFLNILGPDYNSVHTIHIYPGIQTVKKKGFIIGAILVLFNKFLIRKIKYPIACSKSISDTFFKNDNFTLRYIQNGVPKIDNSEKEKKYLKKKLGLDANMKYFITIGRFSPEKNFEFLIKSFSKINDNKFGLIILGEGPLFSNLSKYNTNKIILAGFVHNVYDYLIASEYYVSSSITEGLPMSVLEALSIGLPILLSDIDPHKEILLNNQIGKVGYIYKNNNYDSFKLFFDKLVNVDYPFMQMHSHLLFDNNFTSKIMCTKYERFYSEITN